MPEPTVIAPVGDLDITSAGELRTALADWPASARGGLLLDLSRVTFIDSSGLGVVLEVHERCRRVQQDLWVVAPEDSAAELMFARMGFSRRLRAFDSRREALNRLAEEAL